MTKSKHEWEDTEATDNESQEDLIHTSEPLTPRKRTARKAPPSSSLSTKAARGQRRLPREKDKLHVKPLSKPPGHWKHWAETISASSSFFITYVCDIFRVALALLQKPLSFVLALILVWCLLTTIFSHLEHTFIETLRSTLAPLCFLPGISRMTICASPHSAALSQKSPSPHHTPKHADYPTLIDIQSGTFERLLDESIGGAGMGLEIKKAEMATSDLATLVRVSSLTSKDTIAETLDAFVENARRTTRGLQRFSAKVNGAVDGIIAVDDYALKRIERATPAKSSGRWPSIWNPFTLPSPSLMEVTNSFTHAMAVLESELYRLILAAEASLRDLDTLEEQLRLLHLIVSQEDHSLTASKRELLSNLWTIVGGNRAELDRYESHLKLLSGLTDYRQRALAHVVGALQTLQTMSSELEVLRERVSQPVMLGDTIPLEVHVKSIRGGLDRLMESRLKARRLEEERYAPLLAHLER